MSNPVQHIYRATLLVMAFGPGTWLQAGEKVELKGSTEVELPKPARIFEESRKYKLETGASELEGGFVPAPNVNNAPVDRKLRDMLDKKRNWIFANPYQSQMDSRTSDILESDKSSNPLDHRLLQDQDKGMMQKFVEERGNGRPKGPNSDSLSNSENRDPSEGAQGAMTRDLNGRSQVEDRMTGADSSTSARTGIVFGQPMETQNRMTDFERRMERSPMDGNVFNQAQPGAPKLGKEELRLQQETRDMEFNKLIQPRGAGNSIAGVGASGRVEGLNTSGDATRREMNPVNARRSDQFLNNTRIDFSGGNRNSSLPAGSGGDFGSIGSRIGNEPSFLPSAGSFSAPAPSVSTRPTVIEFTRRKF